MTGHNRAHEFAGVLYGSDRDAHNLVRLIADIVCPTGGTVISKPLHTEDEDTEGNPHGDE